MKRHKACSPTAFDLEISPMCQSKSHHHHHHTHSHSHQHEHSHVHGTHVHVEPAKPSRRAILRGIKAVGLAAAANTLPLGNALRAVADDGHPAVAAGASAKLFDIKRVANGIYGAIARPTAMLNCNAAVIVNSDHVLVVDTHSKPSAAKALIKQIRSEITDRPVRYVVDSHLHGDHAMGNEAYPEVFGANVEIISSTKTREWFEKLGMSRLKGSLEGIPKQLAELKSKRDASKDDYEKAELTATIEGLDAYLKEMTPPRLTLPSMTFSDRLVIHRGGREIHLLFLGRAHTAGDVIAYIPGERVVATGDLMHGLLPYMGDGFPDEWPATLKALEALEFDRVVPGHGAVQEGKGVLTQFRTYVEEITEKVQRGVEKGQPLNELSKAITPNSMMSLKADNARGRIERELGALFPGPVKPSDQLDGSVSSNVREVFTYFTERKGKRELPLQ
jgi:glyoxylase-like metal-dependent hydrolase (beta-lactamase superfamily II)